jgi:hypothetical protein
MKIKSNFIIVCDQAFLTAGTNNLNLIGIFTSMHAEQFPFTYRRFALVINFDTDSLNMHTLETKIVDGDGKELVRSELQINVTSSPFQVIANFENFVFPAPGTYEIKVSLGGQEVGSRIVTVNPAVKTQPHIA